MCVYVRGTRRRRVFVRPSRAVCARQPLIRWGKKGVEAGQFINALTVRLRGALRLHQFTQQIGTPQSPILDSTRPSGDGEGRPSPSSIFPSFASVSPLSLARAHPRFSPSAPPLIKAPLRVPSGSVADSDSM
eukprot:superscaffoldBa00006131_g21180